MCRRFPCFFFVIQFCIDVPFQTVVGLSNEDYPTFIIRTFIDNCINQSLGNVIYAGVRFQGRIDCCATSFCNKNRKIFYIFDLSNFTKICFSFRYEFYRFTRNCRIYSSYQIDCRHIHSIVRWSVYADWNYNINLSISILQITSST